MEEETLEIARKIKSLARGLALKDFATCDLIKETARRLVDYGMKGYDLNTGVLFRCDNNKFEVSKTKEKP